MKSGNFPLNRKETFSSSMVIFIGLFYLLSLGSLLFQTPSIPLHKLIGLTELKFIVLSILFCVGALLFFRQKNMGWIICASALLHFVLVVLQSVVAISQSRNFDTMSAIITCFFLLMLMAFLFLFNKDTRKKFRVNNKSYLFSIALYLVLLLITFLL